ncbi:MAG: PEP-CTERM sorting domain-containing protein [Akkermansiaceae bacterium]
MRNSLYALLSILFGLGKLFGATLFGPSLYFSERDSPWFSGIVDNAGNGIYLENFEDGKLNTPNVRQLPGVNYTGLTSTAFNPNAIPFGVDGDDGLVDGLISSGIVWTTTTNGGGNSQFMDFEFLPDGEGRYPRYVGIVIAGVLNPDSDVEIAWNSPGGESLFDDGEFDPKEWSPPGGAPRGSPQNMRFIGLFAEEGIQTLVLGNVSAADHLQYGYSIPEPSSLFLAATGFIAFIRRKRA